MLFNSFIFILVFLPLVMAGFHLIGRRWPALAKLWLTGASLFFYGWWNPVYLWVIVGAMIVNFAVGKALIARRCPRPRLLLGLGIAANICMLGWFKYAAFLGNNVASLTGASFHLNAIALPLAISFFTFQKIAFLVDAYQGRIEECAFPDYCLFVTFFPQLIAGPIVHYREIAPQISHPAAFRFRSSNLAVGLTLFAMGLFKKVVIADAIAIHADAVFNAAGVGTAPGMAAAWSGALAYTFELYFDFSGYSDMAIGLGRIFNVRLPINFSSPYKAASIGEFWRRWHISLSTFLRDYLYIPLGGNRRGTTRRNINLFLTMLLGGLWHGAGWTFVFWGALHGAYLVIHHGWRALMGSDHAASQPGPFARLPGVLLTFVCVVVGWVFFRAKDFQTAIAILAGMSGLTPTPAAAPVAASAPWLLIGALLAVVWFAPNTNQLLWAYEPALNLRDSEHAPPGWVQRWLWQPRLAWSVVASVAFVWAVSCLARPSQFLYFQF